MAVALDPKQIVSSDKLLMSQVVSQQGVIRLLVEKGIFTKEEFLEMVEVVNLEIRKMV
jgi:hypothetical protein